MEKVLKKMDEDILKLPLRNDQCYFALQKSKITFFDTIEDLNYYRSNNELVGASITSRKAARRAKGKNYIWKRM